MKYWVKFHGLTDEELDRLKTVKRFTKYVRWDSKENPFLFTVAENEYPGEESSETIDLTKALTVETTELDTLKFEELIFRKYCFITFRANPEYFEFDPEFQVFLALLNFSVKNNRKTITADVFYYHSCVRTLLEYNEDHFSYDLSIDLNAYKNLDLESVEIRDYLFTKADLTDLKEAEKFLRKDLTFAELDALTCLGYSYSSLAVDAGAVALLEQKIKHLLESAFEKGLVSERYTKLLYTPSLTYRNRIAEVISNPEKPTLREAKLYHLLKEAYSLTFSSDRDWRDNECLINIILLRMVNNMPPELVVKLCDEVFQYHKNGEPLPSFHTWCDYINNYQQFKDMPYSWWKELL